MKRYDWTKEKVADAVANSINYCDVLRKLGIPLKGNNTSTLKRKIDEYELDTSHFTGRKEVYGRENNAYKSVEYYLNNNKYIQSCKLKDKLLLEGYKENKCECCGLTEWNGKPITLQLHHIDGNHHNNILSNLQILCPNCHSQTDNYCGNANEKEISLCPDCGQPKQKNSKYCRKCAGKYRPHLTENFPTKEELLNKYIEKGSFVQVAKFYRVSDSAVKKWFKYYELPFSAIRLRKIIREQYIDIDWLCLKGNTVGLRKYQIEHFKKIVEINEQGDIIKIFNSPNEIRNDNLEPHHVHDVCRGKLKTHHKRRFKYFED